tara:strand:- start:159 stop:1088 length:930 start_codon:yes stop_codon:yes gene_type:complete
MPFEVTILGASSATPTSDRNHSAQLVNLLGRFFLLDCGEGTQKQLRKCSIKMQKINFICISHLHGDHYLGLMGLLSTMSLLNRKKDLIIYGPKGLDKIIDLHLQSSYSKLTFSVEFIVLSSTKEMKLYEDDACSLFSFGLKHRIPCWGFKLVEKKRKRHMIASMIDKYNIPFSKIESIQLGHDYVDKNSVVIGNHMLTKASYEPRSYAYCSDTKFFKNLSKNIAGVDLLYHESTFHSDLAQRARSTFHSTSKDAAMIALMGGVKKLILGHFSSRYKDLTILKEDAETIFKNVDIAEEGRKWVIKKIYLK